MMKKHMLNATALCVTFMTTSIAHAETLSVADLSVNAKIGFVESFAVMGECEEGQKARQDIETKRDLATQEIQSEAKKLEKSKNDYLAKSTTMSDSARAKEEKRLMKMDSDIKNLATEKEEELRLDMQVATEMLAQGLEAGVAKVAQAEGLDVVFDKMTGRAIYVAEKFDFTNKVTKEVNKNYEVKLAQNKQAESAVKVAENKAITAPKATKVGA